MSPRADRRRRCLACATGLLVSGLLVAGTATGLADTPDDVTSIVTGGESWAPELALEGGDDRGVVLADGGVRPVPTTGSRAEGVLTVAPRRLLGPTEEITGTVSADLPRGTDVELQVRALDAQGAWRSWETVPARGPARLGPTTMEVQVRFLLRGAADGSTVPTARGVWLTAVPAPEGISARAPTTTTALTAGLIWDGSIATQGLGGFKDTPYDITGNSSVQVLDGPRKSIRLTVPSGSQRAEVEPDVGEFGEGETRYFRLTYTLPTTFPADPSGFQLATQWKNDGNESPPLELRIENGKFRLGGGAGRPDGSRLFATDIAPVVTGGRWTSSSGSSSPPTRTRGGWTCGSTGSSGWPASGPRAGRCTPGGTATGRSASTATRATPTPRPRTSGSPGSGRPTSRWPGPHPRRPPRRRPPCRRPRARP